MGHAWSAQMVNLARDLRVQGYEDGTLWFREKNGVEVVVEPLLDGASLAVHARLGRVGWQEDGPGLADLLRANAPSNGRCITAIDAVDEDVVLFRRFDDASLPYEAFVNHVQHFSQAAAEGVTAPAMPQADHADHGVALPTHVEADNVMRNAIGDFAHARGLEPPEDTSHFLVCMPDGGGISVQIEPTSGDVLLMSHFGSVPADETTLRKLLELHMLGELTGGAFFAIDEHDRDLILYRRVGIETLDGMELDRLLNRLGVATVDCAQQVGIALPRFD